MKIFIIGSSGFIGSHLNWYFAGKGHTVNCCDIIGADNHLGKFTLIKQQKQDFTAFFKNEDYDVCINASGSASVPYSIENPDEDFRLNVSNVNSILHAIRRENASCKFINFSSAAVYGNPEKLPVSENSTLQPVSPYGFHKMISEQICNEFSKLYNIKTVNLRVFSAYGPRLKKQIFWDFYNKSIGQDAIELFGTGDETRDFIYIDDVCKAVECVINKAPMIGESVNIATGTEVTVKEAIDIYTKVLNKNIKFSFNGVSKKGDPNNWKADISLLQSYGFNSKNSLENGLTQYVRWLEAN